MHDHRLYGSISKVEDQDDGSIKVFGTASSGARDSQGEIVLPDAMKAALPGYALYPALREMHQPSAAGRTLEAEVDDEGFTRIVAHVVDPIAIAKVKSKTYAGFSIGGKVLKRDPSDRTVITAIQLSEISLVDRPANPEASLDLWKADGLGEQHMAYQPTNDEVKARAGELAKAAGKTAMDAFKGYVVQAREALIAEHAEPEQPALTPETAAKALILDELKKAAPDLGEAEAGAIADEIIAANAGADERDEVDVAVAKVLAARRPTEPAEPTAAELLAAAIAKATEAPAAASPEGPTLADLGKTLVLIQTAHADDLTKGMYHVSRLAELIDTFSSLQSSSVWEARDEGDASPVPQMLTDGIKQMGETLLVMAKEEVAELLAALQARGVELGIVVVDVVEADIALAASVIDLVKADEPLMAKAGARHSSADKAHIQAAHDHMAKLGAVCGEATKAAISDDMAKAATDLIAKQLADIGELKAAAAGEAARTQEAISKAAAEQSAAFEVRLAEEIAKALKLPLPARTAASTHATAVGKADDVDPGRQAEITPEEQDLALKAWNSMTDEQRAMALMKASLRQPVAVR